MNNGLVGDQTNDGEGKGGDIPHRDTTEIVLIVLAVIGGLALLAALGMGPMHVTMMGRMMGGGGWFSWAPFSQGAWLSWSYHGPVRPPQC
jgi:hypothetical protein